MGLAPSAAVQEHPTPLTPPIPAKGMATAAAAGQQAASNLSSGAGAFNSAHAAVLSTDTTAQQSDQYSTKHPVRPVLATIANSSSNGVPVNDVTTAVARQLLSEVHLRPTDAIAAWQSKPAVPVRLLDTYVNYLVLGESGLGKTTCIHNLVSSYTMAADGALKTHDGSATSLTTFQESPNTLKTVVPPMDLVESGRRLCITLQDAPGWSDDINVVWYLRRMIQFILGQRAKDYKLMAGARALDEVAMCGQLRHSITACLYFITPHRLKKVDVIIMCALSQLVTVIPVLAKADTMTDEELAQYRQEVCEVLQDPSKVATSKALAPLSFNSYGFSKQVLGGLHGMDIAVDRLPLAVIGSRVTEQVTNPALLAALGLQQTDFQQPIRRYRWGAAYAFNHEHSDLLLLKRLLLGDKVGSLYALLDESYRRYVEFCQQYEDAGQQVPVLVQAIAAGCTPYLQHDAVRSSIRKRKLLLQNLLFPIKQRRRLRTKSTPAPSTLSLQDEDCSDRTEAKTCMPLPPKALRDWLWLPCGCSSVSTEHSPP